MYARARIAFAIVIVMLPLLALPATAHATPVDDETAFINDINTLRASRGLPALVVHSHLTNTARAFAQTMANSGHIYHNPDLRYQVPTNWLKIGENVGVGGTEPSLHQAFVNSPGHFANLIDGDFRYIGVGVVWQNSKLWVVENFMKSSSPPPSSSTTSTGGAAAAAKATKATKYRAAVREGRLTARSRTQKAILDQYLAKG